MERRESEAQAQAAVFDWARWEQSQTPVLKAMYHAANEGKRSVRAGADLKRQGMKPGVSDICLPYAAGGYNNLYVELKVGNRTQTTGHASSFRLQPKCATNRALSTENHDV